MIILYTWLTFEKWFSRATFNQSKNQRFPLFQPPRCLHSGDFIWPPWRASRRRAGRGWWVEHNWTMGQKKGYDGNDSNIAENDSNIPMNAGKSGWWVMTRLWGWWLCFHRLQPQLSHHQAAVVACSFALVTESPASVMPVSASWFPTHCSYLLILLA